MMAHIYAHEIHHQHFTKAAKAALNRVGGFFQNLGYSIHFTLISFSFIIEGSLVLYILPVVFHIRLSTIAPAV